jgi:hypothetical protein
MRRFVEGVHRQQSTLFPAWTIGDARTIRFVIDVFVGGLVEPSDRCGGSGDAGIWLLNGDQRAISI